MRSKDFTEYSDLEMLSLLGTDFRRGYELIYKKYWSPLLKFAFGFVRDKEQANDIVQEVFIQLMEKEYLLGVRSNLSSYLYITIKRSCIVSLRNKLETVDIEELMDSFLSSTHPEHTSHSILVKELELGMEKELASLPPRVKEIFKLSRDNGLSSKQISLELGISDQSVRNQISRAIHHLKLKIGTYFICL